MIIIVHDQNKSITRIITCEKEQVSDLALQLNLEHYRTYETTNAYIGLSIDHLLENGKIKSDKQLVEEKLIVLQADEVLEGDNLRKLTLQEQVDKRLITLKDDEEIRDNIIVTLSDDEMKEKFPDRYSIEEKKPIKDPVVEELQLVEHEIYLIEQEVLKGIIQDRMEGKI